MKFTVIKKVDSWREESSPDFAIYNHKILKDYFLHIHDFYEIEYTVSGRCIHRINNEDIECGPNSVVFLTPLDLHSITMIEPTEIININFEQTLVDPSLTSLLDKSLYAHNMSDTYINLLFQESSSDKEYSHTQRKLLLNCVLTELYRCANIIVPQKANNIVVDIARYIKVNYSTNLTLDSLSSVFGYTPNYISSQFHKTMETTVKQFITEVRLENAAKALITTSASVTDICFSSGFTSLANFHRAFRKKYNQAPGDYRKNFTVSSTTPM